MKRMKRHKIKKEKPECSSSQQRDQEEHDLAYYIHDRVELMHQVFSMLRYKELKAMAPECVRNLAIGDLQELCTEELLGISSKRLLAILDGADPPSDTESSSVSPPPDELETISLDSISSDEELLASNSKKKKHKHHRHSSKSKSKKKDKSRQPVTLVDENTELSRASRAGLTVLELLELQARARAIRAQLQQEQANKRPSETTAVESSHHSSDNEVEIKEEAADVVEISSEDEKPDINQLNKVIAAKTTPSKATDKEMAKEPELKPSSQENSQIVSKEQSQTVTENTQRVIEEKSQTMTKENSQTVTKHVNNLVITVPHVKPTRKIKLNRNKVTISVRNDADSTPSETRSVAFVSEIVIEKPVGNNKDKNIPEKSKKKKKDKKKKTLEKDGSDHDEITLQLSDSEKMDLFENLDESRKNYDKVSSSSEDSESSSSESEDDIATKATITETTQLLTKTESSTLVNMEEKDRNASLQSHSHSEETEPSSVKSVEESDNSGKNKLDVTKENDGNLSTEPALVAEQQNCEDGNDNTDHNLSVQIEHCAFADQKNNCIEITNSVKNNYITTNDNKVDSNTTDTFMNQNVTEHENLNVATNSNVSCSNTVVEKSSDVGLISSKHDLPSGIILNEVKSMDDVPSINNEETNNIDKESQKDSNKNHEVNKETKQISDGELSDRQSSEVEAIDVQAEIVCISDEEMTESKLSNKKKKKDKKAKKEKKSKKSKSDFHDGADQNFYRDADKRLQDKDPENLIISSHEENTVDLDTDDVYEILELLSDDSSCYEVEGTVLSKEPTAEEIEALSAKIDEIERGKVVRDDQIRVKDQMLAEKEIGEQTDANIDNISWKDRYLGSKKVKKVLTTANILNALRKKNKELKKKIEDSKNKSDKEPVNEETVPEEIHIQLEEGSIEQYNALQGSTKYVDPVIETIEENKDSEDSKNESKTTVTENSEGEYVTKEMKKDAKQLLKMYKKLLKYNDMNKQKDPNKKKKKKQRKKDKPNNGENSVNVTATNTSNVV